MSRQHRRFDAVTAVRLTDQRRHARVGDLFRLSPLPGVILWGRVIERGGFFGERFTASLVYIYDVISPSRPAADMLRPTNLLMGPCVVNSLGWVRGYWEIVASEPLKPADKLPQHLFRRAAVVGSGDDIGDEQGRVMSQGTGPDNWLGSSGFGNFNSVGLQVRVVLANRGILGTSC